MKKMLESLLAQFGGCKNELPPSIGVSAEGVAVYPRSIRRLGEGVLMAARDSEKRFLIAVAPRAKALPDGLEGERIELDNGTALIAPYSHANAAVLRRLFPWCAPKSLRNERTTIGCGDRLGLATRGQLLAASKYALSPVLAQQSIRELTLTGRTFREVVDDACFMVFESDFRDGWGADGDHLKRMEDIDTAIDSGMPMITLDLSDVMNAAAGSWSAAEIDAAFDRLPEADRKRIAEEYADKEFVLEKGSVKIDRLTARRCAVMYDAALDFAEKVHAHLVERRGSEFDLEISIDETASVTLPSHHLYIVRELRRRNVCFSSVAPRFVGEFQKAVDYIGALPEFDADFEVHARIARAYGNYKISVHSGSDKFAVYPTVGRETRGYLHLKTAGTSWLVAVTVIAEHDPALYREMHAEALLHFNEMLKLYHITADITKIPPPETLSDAELPKLMEMAEARQLLHITYGPLLTGKLRERFFKAMHRWEAEYDAALEKHFDKHFSLLGVPPRRR